MPRTNASDTSRTSRTTGHGPKDVWDTHLMQDRLPPYLCAVVPKFPDWMHGTSYDSRALLDEEWDELPDISVLLA